MKKLPNCGIYRTSQQIGSIPAQQLVYFHNHGNPGPGLYLPQNWKNNQVQFSSKGMTLTPLELANTLEPLKAQGLYRIAQGFHCCEQKCVYFEANQLVQLGYNRSAQAILFLPFWRDTELQFPTKGTHIETLNLQFLEPLQVQSDAKVEHEILH